jgi:hypothetical protein
MEIMSRPNRRTLGAGIATDYGLGGRDSIRERCKIFSTPQPPNRLWGLPSLLSNGYRDSFPEGKAAGAYC